jgi:hypothetical protein
VAAFLLPKAVSNDCCRMHGSLKTVCATIIGILQRKKNVNLVLLDRAPSVTIAACHPSGVSSARYMFIIWFKHFVSISESISYDPIVLIFNGHYSCTKSINTINIKLKARRVRCVFIAAFYSEDANIGFLIH